MFQIFVCVCVCVCVRVEIATPLEKSQPPLSQQPPSKSWGPVKPPFWKIWLEVQPFPQQKGGGVHSMFLLWLVLLLILFLFLLFRIALLKLVSTSFFYCKEFYIGVIVAPCAQCLCNFVFSFVYCDCMFHSM